jgi:hypothetical protein
MRAAHHFLKVCACVKSTILETDVIVRGDFLLLIDIHVDMICYHGYYEHIWTLWKVSFGTICISLTLFILVLHTSQYYRMIWLHRPVWLKSIYIYDAFTCFDQLMTIFRRQCLNKHRKDKQLNNKHKLNIHKEETPSGPPRAAIYPIFRW